MPQTLYLEIQTRLGLPEADDAEALAQNVLAMIGSLIQPRDRESLADAMPSELAAALKAGKELTPPASLDDFYHELAALEGVPEGFAKEQSDVVCQLIVQRLEDDVWRLMSKRLPDDYVEWLSQLRAIERSPALARGDRASLRRGHSLASGRPGSEHPLSEGHPDQGHRHSVARSDNPHGDTKLSSAEESPIEGHNLATGKPGSDRPLSEHKD